jgi:hypothetical protein
MTSLWDDEASVLRPDRDVVGYDVEATDDRGRYEGHDGSLSP